MPGPSRLVRLVGKNDVALFEDEIDAHGFDDVLVRDGPTVRLAFDVTPLSRPVATSDDFGSFKTKTQVELLEAFRFIACDELWQRVADAVWDCREEILEELEGPPPPNRLKMEIDFFSEDTAKKIGSALRTKLVPHDQHGRWLSDRKIRMNEGMKALARQYGVAG